MSEHVHRAWKDRKAAFKTPPPQVRDPSASQEQRRKKALEEQKRRRAERFDSSRQLDLFSDLNLGPSDEEVDDTQDDFAATNNTDIIIREGISAFASMLAPSSKSTPAAIPEATIVPHPATTSESVPHAKAGDVQTNGKKRGKNKRKGKARATKPSQQPSSSSSNKPGKWADKCMYAELLEMNESHGNIESDGIPSDLEIGWVAVTPVPVGKRCLAITHAASGIAGIVPNTTLRSRVLGKALMKPFPSPLPPHTVLDCILDDNWHDNGILHVLDVLKWKGQDIADCETPFRFWWRDTRLSELVAFPPPLSVPEKGSTTQSSTRLYQFSYPTTYLTIPYHQDTTLANLLANLIPLSRTTKSIPISVPAVAPSNGNMDLDIPAGQPLSQLRSITMPVHPDGLLLYVSQATYEPGTSPLSTWIPIRAYTEANWKDDKDKATNMEDEVPAEGPLDKFERLLRRRISTRGILPEASMDMDR